MPSAAPLDLSSLSHYKRSITLPTSSRNPVVAKQLTRYHASTKHSEQAAACLQLANHYFTSELFRHALPYYAASLSHTVQCHSQHDVIPVLTLLRRLGECHQQLQHFSSAANAFQTALSTLSLLCAAGSMSKKHWTLKQELLLSLGNSYQDWCDAEEERGYTAGRPLALKAKDAHYDSLMVARRLCGMDKSSDDGAEEAAEDGVRDKAITNMQATVLARAYINLANTLTQLLHFDKVEREAHKRVAATSACADTTDSSSSSASSLEDSSHESSLASTLSSLSNLSLASPSTNVSLSTLAASLYSSALSLAISHRLVEEEQRVYSNRSTLYEEDGQWQEAEEDIKRELKLTRRRKHKSTNKHSKHAASSADVAEQAACKVRLMTLAVKAGQYEQAVKQAKERRRMVEAGVEQEEVDRAAEEVELMEEIRHSVRLKQTTERLLEHMEEDMDDTDDRAHKRRRVDRAAGTEESEEANQRERAAQRHVRLLHRHIDVCLSLAERNVDSHNNYAAALAAHQHALDIISSLPPTTTALTLAVHSYHLYTITRYLPWLLPQQHSPDEVQRWMTIAQTTIDTCKPLARGADRGILALLESHLKEQCGVECDELLKLLQAAVEVVEREGGGMVVRGQLLREQSHVLDVMGDEEEREQQFERVQHQRAPDDSAGAAPEGESEAVRARRARRKVQRILLKGQMEAVQRWAARHEEEAAKQRHYIQSGLWMLGTGDNEGKDSGESNAMDGGESSDSSEMS